MSGEALFFYLLAAVLIATAAAMVLARNVVHAVLFMVANFVGTTLLYLMLQAPFIAAVQLIVYAGAIMVLFLFVVMLLGSRDLSLREPLGGQRLFGVTLAALLGGLLVFVVWEGVPAAPAGGMPAVEALPSIAAGGAATGGPVAGVAAGAFGSPQMIGAVLFSDYVLPFELVSVLLLVAMLGAVIIAQFRGRQDGARPATPPEGGAP